MLMTHFFLSNSVFIVAINWYTLGTLTTVSNSIIYFKISNENLCSFPVSQAASTFQTGKKVENTNMLIIQGVWKESCVCHLSTNNAIIHRYYVQAIDMNACNFYISICHSPLLNSVYKHVQFIYRNIHSDIISSLIMNNILCFCAN